MTSSSEDLTTYPTGHRSGKSRAVPGKRFQVPPRTEETAPSAIRRVATWGAPLLSPLELAEEVLSRADLED